MAARDFTPEPNENDLGGGQGPGSASERPAQSRRSASGVFQPCMRMTLVARFAPSGSVRANTVVLERVAPV